MNSISFSRTSQRRSKAAEALLALISARNSIVVSLQSVTCRLTTLPFHNLDLVAISVSLARIASTGALWSRYSITLPIKSPPNAGPVLKRLFDEVAERHHHAPQIPQPDYDIIERDLFDIAPFVLDDDGVVDADRLRHRELHAGEQIGEQRPRRKAEDQAGDAGRSKERNAVLAHRVERHQREAERQQHDHRVERPQHHAHLRDVLARQEIVFNVNAELQQVKAGCDVQHGQRNPSDPADRRKPEETGEHALRVRRQRCGRQRDGEGDEQCGKTGRIMGCFDDGAQIGPLAAAKHAVQDDENRGMGEPRGGEGDKQDGQRHEPSRGKREFAAQFREFRLKAVRDVLHHELV
jgi:hypothetical protein